MTMIPNWQKGIVTRIEQATANTRRYWLHLPESPDFTFKPGQFVTFDLPIHEQRNKRWRSYSIASPPDGNTIELVISYMEGGLGSKYLFEEVTEGSEITARGPQGIFTLPDVIDKDLFLICTGTGIAPFRSMVHHIQRQHVPHKHIRLIFGTRTRHDLLYFDEMRQLAATIPSFSYHPILSREEWEGPCGYVHDIYEQLCSATPEAMFMLCGWRAMIDEARERIVKLGYSSKDVHYEIYG